MLELYHGSPAANSLKALLPLKEKGVEYTSHYMNLLEFEQHEPWFVKINPNGQVPVLVHDGRTLTESTVINEYVDETFPGAPLRPADAYGRAQMRIWTKFVDEYFCPALSFLGWHRMIKHAVQHLTPEEFEARVQRIPLKEQRDKWRESAAQVWTDSQLEDWQRRVHESIRRMEQGMQGPWMLGSQFTLADVSLFAMLIRMPDYYSNIVNARDSPRVVEWYTRMMERPAVKATLAIQPPAKSSSAPARHEGGRSTAGR
ncbi:MAG TPA: glutathione S-transferase family protein [Steroidobacteraceae bacterium]|jgi:glutathione S-transferase|nr:glutathione S-transferase family protein [Steroidobacteraceae bacterium]